MSEDHEMTLQESANVMKKMSKLLKETYCDLMIFDSTYQITDIDKEESYNFKSPEKALQYLENKKEYIEKQFILINEHSS